MELVVIKAHDLCYLSDPDEDETYCTMTAVISGVVVDETDDHVSIANMYFPLDGTCRNVVTIPKGTIYYRKSVSIPDRYAEDKLKNG